MKNRIIRLAFFDITTCFIWMILSFIIINICASWDNQFLRKLGQSVFPANDSSFLIAIAIFSITIATF
jgi:hypothetical protein